ncbi:zinc finger BED domain-containing protein RICESLEEPER 2-like [Dioscorea cayenensis subsp. rotundata]|uniref:Zinc finger BED domain-containing protein RICESLEEPER 2-like n=1 Tax=Dioscorea cayennensis subsp. rotundata TaxID=55577 RepID=A0AB40AVH4_DIOCR|nr:zinc finger BED domain-containing protein RICESLEEPER 2-like [Dioscorea cayenensis subsp. rotundata]
MVKMREAVAHWILMHEHPFSIAEEEGFNMMQQRGMPQWEKISRVTAKKDCMLMYENEKKRLFALLKNVNKISLTTDMWMSSPQKMEYMIVTGHFVDIDWKLQKRVLNFVHLTPPLRGIDIADAIYKCCKEWGIEGKVFTISVDNASKNDVAIRNLKDTFARHKKLLCGGRMFHVRCTAHILNIMVQFGLSKIESVIENIRDSVVHIKQSEERLIMFSEIVQQLQLPYRKLVLDCKTRWNSTYEMLSVALKFKDVFPRYKDRDITYDCCPSNEDWEKAEKVCEILEVFNSTTNIIFGSEYPTSNLFLNEVFRVKEVLDRKYQESGDGDNFIFDMVTTQTHILDVKNCLYELYNEYLVEYQSIGSENSLETTSIGCTSSASGSSSGWSQFQAFVKTVETITPQKSDLDIYLKKGAFICDGDSRKFDAFGVVEGKYLKSIVFLSKMARDVLAIPITHRSFPESTLVLAWTGY